MSVLVFRPQEVVAAIQALDQAYRDYFTAVGDFWNASLEPMTSELLLVGAEPNARNGLDGSIGGWGTGSAGGSAGVCSSPSEPTTTRKSAG